MSHDVDDQAHDDLAAPLELLMPGERYESCEPECAHPECAVDQGDYVQRLIALGVIRPD